MQQSQPIISSASPEKIYHGKSRLCVAARLGLTGGGRAVQGFDHRRMENPGEWTSNKASGAELAMPARKRVFTQHCWSLLLRGDREGCDPEFVVYGHHLQVGAAPPHKLT